MEKHKKIFVILGPTSTGKTSLAINLCKKFNGDIISADSRQICKYMDVGTGKLPVNATYPIVKDNKKWVLNGINIWGYDLINPDEYFSAYDFAKFALNKVGELQDEGKIVFIVGGTGLYIDAVTGRIQVSGVPPDFKFRKSLEKKSLAELQAFITSLNMCALNSSDWQNKYRLIRLLEKKQPPNSCTTPLPFFKKDCFTFIGLTASRKFLYSRADVWAELVWQKGLTDEVKMLKQLGFGNSSRLNGLVYKSVVGFLQGDLSKKEAIQKTKFDLHAYIRRQQTYFKKNKEILWFDISEDSHVQSVYNVVKGLYG